MPCIIEIGAHAFRLGSCIFYLLKRQEYFTSINHLVPYMSIFE